MLVIIYSFNVLIVCISFVTIAVSNFNSNSINDFPANSIVFL